MSDPSDLQCPECGSRKISQHQWNNTWVCDGCTAGGTLAYFTPQVPERDEADAKIPGPPEVQPSWNKAYKNGDRRGMEMVPAPTIVRPDAADLELARRSRLE